MLSNNSLSWFFGLMLPVAAYATSDCFVAKEYGKVIKQQGECSLRHSPYSTFKVPLAVMGFDSGILKTSEKPVVEFTPEIQKSFESTSNDKKYPLQLFSNRAQTPATWMKYSVVWYSRYITQQLGANAFQNYVNLFNYGNKDVSGDSSKKDGLYHSWDQSSLKISPLEQIEFIEKLSQKKLPVSTSAQENTIKIMTSENIWDDWKLYGKNGGNKKEGWFIGWIEKGSQKIVFVQYIEQSEDALINAGKVAKEVAKDNLIELTLS